MRKFLLVTALAAGLPVAAYAAPSIVGIIDFDGSNSYDTTAHTVSFVNPSNVSSDTIGLPTCNSCATWAGATGGVWNYVTETAYPTLISVADGASTFSFDLSSVTSVAASAGFLDVGGLGTMHETGFAATPGTFFFSTQGPQGPEVSFSATVVPEPASLGILGIGLLGLGYVARRSRA